MPAIPAFTARPGGLEAEIIRLYRQPSLTTFTGKIDRAEPLQNRTVVVGCYDEGGELEGMVSGNLHRATAHDHRSGIPSDLLKPWPLLPAESI